MKESEYFTQELSLGINYSGGFIEYPHYPIACFLPHLYTVAHNYCGKRINLKTKRKRLAPKRITSWQKEKDSRQNFFDADVGFLLLWGCGYSFCRGSFSFCREVIVFTVRFFFLPWGYSLCCEVFLFAVRLILLPWQLWAILVRWGKQQAIG